MRVARVGFFPILTLLVVLTLGRGAALSAQDQPSGPPTPRTLPGSKLVVDQLVIDRATGNPRLVTFEGKRPSPKGATSTAKAIRLLSRHAAAFGLVAPARELRAVTTRTDPLGGEQVVFQQQFHGVPVFGSLLRVHLTDQGTVTAINGTIISGIDVDPVPQIGEHEAESIAVRLVAKSSGRAIDRLDVSPAALKIYREGLVRGLPGENHLAWEIEVASPPDLREVLYIDAHHGLLIDRRSEIHHLSRVIHLGYRPRPIWSEGDPLPYNSGNAFRDNEINDLIESTGETFDLFANLTNNGYLSYDGADATMNSVYDADNIDCPNAVESDGVTAYCEGMVSDDVAAHEWTHAYTEWTHALVYQWQPGALNESYSDIFGELVDQLNGRGGDTPGNVRSAGGCSAGGGSPPPALEITEPPSVAGSYAVGGAVFNPNAPWTVSARVERVDDGTGDPWDACQPLIGFPSGSIALIDRGTCFFRDKVLNAQSSGAVGVIMVINQGEDIIEMGGDLPRLAIPSVFLGQSDGGRIKASLDDEVMATLSLDGNFVDSVRWLVGEDTDALGAIRDMWSPSCFGDPGRVGSVNYHCSTNDNGGVHTNSGISNHAFAMLVDGGSYNGFQIEAIGHTKAARIYWRAMSIYQTPVTDFADHADLLETSCLDLVGATLYDPMTGSVSPEIITSADCAEVASAMAAVEMRDNPDQCGFRTLLDPDPPRIEGNVLAFLETFDEDPAGGWSLNNRGVFPEYEPRDWVWTEDLPTGGDGGAFFAIDSVLIGDCRPGSDDQSGVMELTSPVIEIPHGISSPVVAFDHWVATEPAWDGGNVKISVNDGSFFQVPSSAFRFNPYNGRINLSSNTNPMAGESAFTGTDGGSLSGSWGQSQIDLEAFVRAGDLFRLRFDFGVDGCNGAKGWYVDNVRLVVTQITPRRATRRVQP